MNDGSAKMVKVYMDQVRHFFKNEVLKIIINLKGREKIVTVPSPRTSLLILDAENGDQLAFSGDGWEVRFPKKFLSINKWSLNIYQYCGIILEVNSHTPVAQKIEDER